MSHHTHFSTEPNVDCSSVLAPSGEDRPLCFHSGHRTADLPYPQGTGPRTPRGKPTSVDAQVLVTTAECLHGARAQPPYTLLVSCNT